MTEIVKNRLPGIKRNTQSYNLVYSLAGNQREDLRKTSALFKGRGGGGGGGIFLFSMSKDLPKVTYFTTKLSLHVMRFFLIIILKIYISHNKRDRDRDRDRERQRERQRQRQRELGSYCPFFFNTRIHGQLVSSHTFHLFGIDSFKVRKISAVISAGILRGWERLFPPFKDF